MPVIFCPRAFKQQIIKRFFVLHSSRWMDIRFGTQNHSRSICSSHCLSGHLVSQTKVFERLHIILNKNICLPRERDRFHCVVFVSRTVRRIMKGFPSRRAAVVAFLKKQTATQAFAEAQAVTERSRNARNWEALHESRNVPQTRAQGTRELCCRSSCS